MSVYVKRNPSLSLANVLYSEKKKIRKIAIVVVHFETRCLNTLSGNEHNYICSALTLCIYVICFY